MSSASSPDLFLTNPSRSWVGWLARHSQSSLFCVGFLLILASILFFYGIGASELWRTETLRAIIAREMMDAGNWIVPRLYGEPLFTKPPGMYIAIILCSLPGGEVTAITARVPSAIAATLSVLLFYWYFRRILGRQAGLIAALILPMSALWLDKTPSAEIDNLQVFWVLASILFFLRATEDESAGGSFRWWLASLLCMALGVLTKWTAPEFFYGTVIPFLWWRGRLSMLWRWPHLVSVSIAACLCLGWVGLAVWMEGWPVFWNTVSREAFSRLVPGYSERTYPFLQSLLHPLKLLGVMLPWSLFAIFTLRKSFMSQWDERGRRLLQALHCWAWPQIFFWSLLTEHATRHSFPLFPSIAGLAAFIWYSWASGYQPEARARDAIVPRSRFGLISRLAPMNVLGLVLLLWIGVKIVFVQKIIPAHTEHRYTSNKASLLASLVPTDQLLYLFRIKDEGLMFYYARPALRLHEISELDRITEPRYCLLPKKEWQSNAWPSTAQVVQFLKDAQGDAIVLIRITPGRV